LETEIKIHCKYDELVNPNDLKEHPKNHNKHGQDQIERLADLYSFHGIRHPIICDADDKQTIIAGRGRQLAAIRAGIKEFPVVYQKFDSEEQRYAFIQSDNAIALWSELDLAAINADLPEFGPDFNIDFLGLKNFKIDISEKLFEGNVDFPDLSGEKGDIEQITFTLHKDQKEIVLAAIEMALENIDSENKLNSNKNGNAITEICEKYVNS